MARRIEVDAREPPARRETFHDGAIDLRLVVGDAAYDGRKELFVRIAHLAVTAEAMLDELASHGFSVHARELHLIDGLHRSEPGGTARDAVRLAARSVGDHRRPRRL